jgi:hypothetical protein
MLRLRMVEAITFLHTCFGGLVFNQWVPTQKILENYTELMQLYDVHRRDNCHITFEVILKHGWP